jgi:DNA polymerase
MTWGAFIGVAGKLINRLLEFAELRREEVYIANTLKYRPPGNADSFRGHFW